MFILLICSIYRAMVHGYKQKCFIWRGCVCHPRPLHFLISRKIRLNLLHLRQMCTVFFPFKDSLKNQSNKKWPTLSGKKNPVFCTTWVPLMPKICIYIIPHLHRNKISRENHPTDDWQFHGSSPSDQLSP